MAKPADISTKKLISLAPNNWARWVTNIPDIVANEIINSDFQWISRESDVLIRVESPQYGEFLILNEVQLRYSSRDYEVGYVRITRITLVSINFKRGRIAGRSARQERGINFWYRIGTRN